MPSDHQSFQVHLASLTDFARELGTQLAGMATAAGPLEALAGKDLPLGLFGEAHALSTAHTDAVADFREVLGRAREAIDFAGGVTDTVAESYRQADRQTAAELSRLGIDTGSG